MTSDTRSHLTLTLESAPPTIVAIEDAAFDFAHLAGFDANTCLDIAMVAREAAANAVIHANHYDRTLYVSADFEADSDSVRIRVSDEGGGFDPDSLPDPLAEENLFRPHGRGVFLMRSLMDEVHFRQLSPGTELTLFKRRKG